MSGGHSVLPASLSRGPAGPVLVPVLSDSSGAGWGRNPAQLPAVMPVHTHAGGRLEIRTAFQGLWGEACRTPTCLCTHTACRERGLPFPVPGALLLPLPLYKSAVALLGIPFGLWNKKKRGRKRDRLEGEETNWLLAGRPQHGPGRPFRARAGAACAFLRHPSPTLPSSS